MVFTQALQFCYQGTCTSYRRPLSLQSDHWWHKSYTLGCYRANAAAELFNTKTEKLSLADKCPNTVLIVPSPLLPTFVTKNSLRFDSDISALSSSLSLKKYWILWLTTSLNHSLRHWRCFNKINVFVCWGVQMHRVRERLRQTEREEQLSKNKVGSFFL